MKSTNTQAMSDKKKPEREAFEGWLRPYWTREKYTDPDGDVIYRESWVQGAWVAWQALSQPQAGEIEVEIESVGSCMLQTRRDGNGRLKVFMPQITVADIMQRVKVQAEHVDLRPAPYPAHGEPGALEQGDAL